MVDSVGGCAYGWAMPAKETSNTEESDVIGVAWCAECRTRRDVVDEFQDSHYEPRGEVACMVTVMDCGHTAERGEHVIGPSPGAPYAGSQQVMAASHRPAALVKARPIQPPEDPWN